MPVQLNSLIEANNRNVKMPAVSNYNCTVHFNFYSKWWLWFKHFYAGGTFCSSKSMSNQYRQKENLHLWYTDIAWIIFITSHIWNILCVGWQSCLCTVHSDKGFDVVLQINKQTDDSTLLDIHNILLFILFSFSKLVYTYILLSCLNTIKYFTHYLLCYCFVIFSNT
jgi:hypothetical protein